jgi:hypothetical protein
MKIKHEISQGDCLSVLWFCLAMNPLSNALNETGYDYHQALSLKHTPYATCSIWRSLDSTKNYRNQNKEAYMYHINCSSERLPLPKKESSVGIINM